MIDFAMPRPPKKFGKKHRGKPPSREAVPARRDRRPAAKRPSPPREASQPGEPGAGERLQKVLAAAGVASRRECEQLILEGRVEVDGQVVNELGARVDRQRQEIRVDGEPLPRPKLQYFAVNKPTGVVSTARDPAGRPRVIDLLPPGVGRMFNVGRLDLASEGLILVTNDGMLANQLTHPKHGVEKVYEVQVAGQPDPDVLAQLKRGVHLAEGFAHALDVRVKGRKKRSTILEMVLDEGRNREVRRLLARVGHKVQRLTRIAIGPIRLGDLPRGAVRPLTPEEVRKLRDAVAEGRRPVRSLAPPTTGMPAGPRRIRKRPRQPADGAPRVRIAKKRPMGVETEPERRIIGEVSSSTESPPARPSGAARRKGGPPKRPGGGPPQRPGRRPGKRHGGGPKRSGRS